MSSTVSDPPLESFLAPFGLAAFRPGQREVIETVLAGRNCLCVMPTGGGKSLCYQLPAIARHGLTLVVSPLIALMKDQVDALCKLGLKATFVNSSLSPDEQGQRLAAVAAGQFDLVYVAPERFRSPRFQESISRARLNLLAIDEAHCISEWGHDFRPDYARLGRFRQQLGDPPTIALTATATPTVRADIVTQLGLGECQTFVAGFARPNLEFAVEMLPANRDKNQALVAFLAGHPGAGIVYASSRKRCEEVAGMISQQARRRTGVYHAGMLPPDRRAAQEAFMQGRHEIVVATLAFGMGIDKADVRFVVHYNMPGSLEAYYQEAGRAGRDGLPANCLLLYSLSDRYIHEFFIESAYPAREVVQQVYDFFRESLENPLQITQQELKERLQLPIGAEGVGACEKLLEQAGVIERLEAVENMAAVRVNSDLPTLLDLVPTNATVKRRVLRAIEKIVGAARREWVYVHPRNLAAQAEVEPAALARTLRELTQLDSLDYAPPFRGRAIHVVRRDVPFERLAIDFDSLERRKKIEYDRLEQMVQYAHGHGCRQQEILRYFGQHGAAACGNCDQCRRAAAPAATAAPAAGDGVQEALRIVLAGVARGRERFGKQIIAQMLWGSTSEKVTRLKLDQLSTYGRLSGLKQDEVGLLIDAALALKLLEQVDVDRFRPVLNLTSTGREVMAGRAGLPGRPKLPGELVQKLHKLYGGKAGAAKPAAAAAGRSGLDGQAAGQRTVGGSSKSTAKPPHPDSPPVVQATAPGARQSNAVERASGAVDQQPAPTARAAPPAHYWTWRLLEAGFSAGECATIRGLSPEVVLDHALRAADEGRPIRAASVFDEGLRARLAAAFGTTPPPTVRQALAQLPPEVRYEQVQLYLKCQGR